MKTIQIEPVFRSGPVEAVLIRTTYSEPYSERDFNGTNAVSFPLQSCFGYRAAGREYVADDHVILLERQDTEYSVRKFKPFQADTTLSIQLRDDPEIIDVLLAADSRAAFFRRKPGVEIQLRRFLAEREPLRREQRLFHLLQTTLLDDAPEPASDRRSLNLYQNRQVMQAKDFIHACHREPLTIARIAAAANISPFHFSRLFGRATGSPPYEYLLQVRLEDARHLLLAGLPVWQAAATAGFNSLENFSAAFKKWSGSAPGRFQKSKIY